MNYKTVVTIYILLVHKRHDELHANSLPKMLQKLFCLRQPQKQQYTKYQANLSTEYNQSIPCIFEESYNRILSELQNSLDVQAMQQINNEMLVLNKVFNSAISSRPSKIPQQLQNVSTKEGFQTPDVQQLITLKKAKLQQEKEIQSIQDENTQLTLQKINLENELSKLKNNFQQLLNKEIEKQSTMINQAKDALIDQNAKLQITIQNLETQNNEYRSLSQQQTAEIEDMNAQLSVNKQELAIHQQLSQKLEKDKTDQNNVIDDLNAKIANLQKQIDQSNLKADQMLTELSENADWKGKFEIMSAKYQQLQIAEDQCRAIIEQNNASIIEYQQQISQQKLDLDNIQNRVSEQEIQLQEFTKLKNEHLDLEKQIHEMNEKNQKLQNEVSVGNSQLQNLREQVQQLNKQLIQSNQQIQEKNSTIYQHEKKLGEYNDIIQQQYQSIIQVNEKLDEKNLQFDKLNQCISDLNDQVQQLNFEKQQLINEHAEQEQQYGQLNVALEQEKLQQNEKEIQRLKSRLQQRNKTIKDLISYVNQEQIYKESISNLLLAKLKLNAEIK